MITWTVSGSARAWSITMITWTVSGSGRVWSTMMLGEHGQGTVGFVGGSSG